MARGRCVRTGPSLLARPATRERATLFACGFLLRAPVRRCLFSCHSAGPRQAWAPEPAAPPLAPVGVAVAVGGFRRSNRRTWFGLLCGTDGLGFHPLRRLLCVRCGRSDLRWWGHLGLRRALWRCRRRRDGLSALFPLATLLGLSALLRRLCSGCRRSDLRWSGRSRRRDGCAGDDCPRCSPLPRCSAFPRCSGGCAVGAGGATCGGAAGAGAATGCPRCSPLPRCSAFPRCSGGCAAGTGDVACDGAPPCVGAPGAPEIAGAAGAFRSSDFPRASPGLAPGAAGGGRMVGGGCLRLRDHFDDGRRRGRRGFNSLRAASSSGLPGFAVSCCCCAAKPACAAGGRGARDDGPLEHAGRRLVALGGGAAHAFLGRRHGRSDRAPAR